MLLFLFAVVLLLSVLLIPLGLPGTWLMLIAALVVRIVGGADRISTGTLIAVALFALMGEALEFAVGVRYTRRYGGSRRAGWGAVAGGVLGALFGVPVPVLGSVIGAFLGAFVGAYLAERTRKSDHGIATRVATGALIGRAVGSAIKTAFGLTIAAWLLVAAWS